MADFLTSKEVNEAEAWVRLRLSAIGSYQIHLDEYIREAMEKIVPIIYRYRGNGWSVRTFSFGANWRMSAEIEAVISEMKRKIEEALDELVEFDEEEADAARRRMMEDTLDTYIERWEREEESLLACGLMLNLKMSEMTERMEEAMDDPWGSSLFVDGKEKANSIGTDNAIILAGGVSYGVGHSNVGKTMLGSMGAVYITNVYGDKQLAAHKDATMFLSLVADSKACDYCVEEQERGWQPIANYSGAWHPNCRCRFIFR